MERVADRNEEETRARFWSFVEKTDGCWTWTGVIRTGYGQFKLRGRYYSAHRFAYEMLVAPIPPGMTLDHLCHTNDESCLGGVDCPHRACVNPAHLEVVTMKTNLARGRSPSARPDLYPHIYPAT